MSRAKINNAHVATMQGQLRSLVLKCAKAGYTWQEMEIAIRIGDDAWDEIFRGAIITAEFVQNCGHKKPGRKRLNDDLSEHDANGDA
jgi:hypothetical protein